MAVAEIWRAYYRLWQRNSRFAVVRLKAFVDRNWLLPLTGQQIFERFLVYSALASLFPQNFAGFGSLEVGLLAYFNQT